MQVFWSLSSRDVSRTLAYKNPILYNIKAIMINTKEAPVSDFQKEGIVQRLAQLDDDLLALYGPAQRFELTIIGGSALIVG
jgi:hypothetical protein